MEQRNGRVDRYGQARDVELFHFDSPDDASMRFLGRVLFKRSQTREDHIATDEIARAVLDHFEHDEDPAGAQARLDRAIVSARATQNVDDIPDDVDVLDAAERDRVARLRSALDLSPDTLREHGPLPSAPGGRDSSPMGRGDIAWRRPFRRRGRRSSTRRCGSPPTTGARGASGRCPRWRSTRPTT